VWWQPPPQWFLTISERKEGTDETTNPYSRFVSVCLEKRKIDPLRNFGSGGFSDPSNVSSGTIHCHGSFVWLCSLQHCSRSRKSKKEGDSLLEFGTHWKNQKGRSRWDSFYTFSLAITIWYPYHHRRPPGTTKNASHSVSCHTTITSNTTPLRILDRSNWKWGGKRIGEKLVSYFVKGTILARNYVNTRKKSFLLAHAFGMSRFGRCMWFLRWLGADVADWYKVVGVETLVFDYFFEK